MSRRWCSESAPGSRSPGSGQRGQATVEFALIFTLFFLLVAAVIQGAFLFNAYLTVTNGAREAARWGAVCYNRTAPPPGTTCSLADVQNYAIQATRGVACSYLQATASIDSSTAPRNLTVAETCGVPIVTPFFDSLLPNPLPMGTKITVRIENPSG